MQNDRKAAMAFAAAAFLALASRPSAYADSIDWSGDPSAGIKTMLAERLQEGGTGQASKQEPRFGASLFQGGGAVVAYGGRRGHGDGWGRHGHRRYDQWNDADHYWSSPYRRHNGYHDGAHHDWYRDYNGYPRHDWHYGPHYGQHGGGGHFNQPYRYYYRYEWGR